MRFYLECQSIVSEWLKEANEGTLRVQWKNKTAEYIPNMIRTHHERHLTEFAAIGITCILFPNVVNLSGMEVSEMGTRADYWISAASCYSMAGKYHQARDLFQFILYRYSQYMTEKRLSKVRQLKEECDEAIKKQKENKNFC